MKMKKALLRLRRFKSDRGEIVQDIVLQANTEPAGDGTRNWCGFVDSGSPLTSSVVRRP